ncbi:hypothetical protein HV127_20850 [Klebsiella sp. RHBSTW-00215]|nr:hypothetical protein [Klebsiella sp. RHBSTW-00215]
MDISRFVGLQIYRHLRIGSPGKARQAPPPGKTRGELVNFPEAMLRICLGYGFTAAPGNVLFHYTP